METRRKIEIILTSIFSLAILLISPYLYVALFGMAVFGFSTVSFLELIHSYKERNREGEIKYGISSLLSLLSIIIFASILTSPGIGLDFPEYQFAENPLTGKCNVAYTTENPFPWYYNENSCHVGKCTGEEGEAAFCEEIRNADNNACQAKLSAKTGGGSSGEAVEIPDTCFVGNISTMPSTPSASPGDRVRRTENGYELVESN